ncbi:hypothetical protein KZZ52_32630 [Dactylosporangium sp. AC04546]|uniref:hypothetical protein n=1 Tax=Dactylosporangium sp. AC04546 TaxID=2862460 RepID=UPI001EDFF755|nr:hypothetical protein [Dactylosporangium sp. AC04546]WVK78739.1 hypothetical protein KZZ52_32630 [Dactylosporangium sp. AC04546]
MNRLHAWRLAAEVPRDFAGHAWQDLVTAAADGDEAAVAAVRRLVGRQPYPLPIRAARGLWSIVLADGPLDPALWEAALDGTGPHPADHRLRALLWVTDPHHGPLDGDPRVHATVLEAAARGDGHPIAAMARGRLLEHGAAAFAEQLCELALDRPELAEWCAAHDLLPADPTEAAVFLLLTWQLERYRAADPDGRLVAAAFTGADPQRRGRLLAAMANEGDFDLVAVAAGQVSDRPDHRGLVVEHFAARNDWPQLWRLIWDLPIVEAAAAVQRTGDWSPDGPADRALHAVLAGADLEWLAGTAEVMPEVDRVVLPGRPLEMALSPGGARLAVGYAGPLTGRVHDVEVATDAGGPHCHWDPGPDGPRHLVHLGGVMVGAERTGLFRYEYGGRERLYDEPVVTVLPLGTGFVALAEDGTLLFGDADGLTREQAWPAPDRPYGLAAAPGGRQLAVAAATRLHLLDGWGAPVASVAAAATGGLAFTAHDTLVTLAGGQLTRWHAAQRRLERRDAVPATGGRLDVVDGMGLLVLTDGDTVVFRDAATLAPCAPDLEGPAAHPYPRAAAGRIAVARPEDGPTCVVEVLPPPAHRLVGRPIGGLTPADLATVEAEVAADRAGPWERRLLELLRDTLRVRFDHEIALGGSASVAGDTDIVIARGEPA